MDAGTVMPAEGAPDRGNRAAITVCVILASLMQALDTTIANVALPHMQGSVSASQDQIGWVLTSYIVAAAIMIPVTGFLAGRFGIKRLFLVSIAGFTLASMLCGMAQSLVEIVLFRILQGLLGAALVPLSQTVLLDIYPKERQGFAMGLWGVAVTAGPVLGPVLGGWLTETYNWRYVFYINLPIGVLAFLGTTTFLSGTARSTAAKLDWFGFFVRSSLFRNRTFTAGILFSVIFGLVSYASLALQLPYLQDLKNDPIVTAGLAMEPRGVGQVGAMMIVGKLIGRVDTPFLLGIGLGLTAWSFYEMTGWTSDVSQMTIIVIGVIQGIGLGFLFVPLSIVTLSTLSSELRAEGAGLYSLSRNIGSIIGILMGDSLVTRNTQINRAEITQYIAQFWNPITAAGRAALDAAITQQAHIVAYIEDYMLLMLATLAVIPLLIVFKKPSHDRGMDHAGGVEFASPQRSMPSRVG